VDDDQVARVLEHVKAKGPGPVLAGQERERRVDDDAAASQVEGSADKTREGEVTAAVSSRRHPTIDGYTIIREIGRGGMGVVYEAEDEKLSRRVALKILPGVALHDESQVTRFEREARAAARLHHTNIVPVFGVGRQDGRPYYVMQYIAGWGLDIVLGELRRLVRSGSSPRRLQGPQPHHEPRPTEPRLQTDGQEPLRIDAAGVAHSLATGMFAADKPIASGSSATDPSAGETAVLPSSADSRATPRPGPSLPGSPGSSVLAAHSDFGPSYFKAVGKIGLQVAEAMDYANRGGVLHRDIKPSNLLLEPNGNIWVADFGLAKTADADDLTHTGDILGTVRYMAAERFQGQCDARCDIYSLGLTLYELVALRPAYDASDRYELIERVRQEEPARLGTLAPKVPRDLETIIHKAIAHGPAQRYATAAALAEDLRRFLEDRPIQARRASIGERVLRWCRRNPWVAAFVLALALGAIGSTWQAVRATGAERVAKLAEATTRTERDRAQTERGRAQAERDRAETERNRAEKSRDRAISAVQVLLGTEIMEASSAEVRPYRLALIAAGLRESTALVRELERDPRAESQRGHAYEVLADLRIKAGDHAAALEPARNAVDVAERLAARDPSSIGLRASLASALHHLAAILPDDASRRSAARRSNEILQALVTSHPEGDRVGWLSLIAMNHYNTGHLAWAYGRYPEALEAFLAARTAFERALQLDDHSPATLYFAAANLLYLCRALSVKRSDDSIAAGQQALAIFRALVHDHPEHFGYAWQLYLADAELGQKDVALARWEQAIDRFQDARTTLQDMAAKHGGSVSKMAMIQGALAEADYNLSEAYRSDPARYAVPMRAIAREAYEICVKLRLVQPPDWNRCVIYAQQCFEMADYQEEEGGKPDLDLVLQSERSWADLHRRNPAFDVARAWLVIVRRKLAFELAARGRSDEGSRWRRLSLTTARGHADLLYEIALIYATRIGPIGLLPTKLDRDQLQARRRRFGDDALAMLREAVADGFKDGKRLRSEPAFASIRSTREFQAILSGLEFPPDPFARP